jgi:hypothetical protein
MLGFDLEPLFGYDWAPSELVHRRIFVHVAKQFG